MLDSSTLQNGTQERCLSQMTVHPPPNLATENFTAASPPQYWLYVLFFFSGFPALIYQIVWQRALFIIYGVNVESVTVVVTAFMLGLGLGSLVGGRVSRSRWPLVPVFAAVELCTSLYGILSLHLFHGAAQFTAGASTLLTGVCAFALVVTPTLLMGSTLPILLAYLVKAVPNMGRATGILYFVNTLGSATACFAAGEFTMRLLGMSGSVRLAAAINALVGFSALVAWISTRKRSAAVALGNDVNQEASTARVLPFSAGLALATFSGFIALGYEMVWYRVFSWGSGTNPKTFALLLGSYLAGLALGALGVERRCRSIRPAANHLWFTGVTLVAGNVIAVLVPVIFSFAPERHAQFYALVWLAGGAALLGTTFPMVCHLTVRPDRSAGQGLSYLYLSNIVGSAAGSFVVGYILTEFLPLPVISALLATAGVVFGLILIRRSGVQSPSYAAISAAFVLPPLASIALDAFSGFTALGYGMMWYLLFSSAGNTTRASSAFLLGSYLAGLALGAIGVERRCRSLHSASNHLWFAGIMLVGGNALAVLVPSISSVAPRNYAQLIAMVWVACTGAMLGTTLPIVRRLAARPDGSTEKNLSFLNLSFVAGAAAGSFLSGYVLIQMFSLPVIGAWFAVAGVVLGFSLMLRSGVHTPPNVSVGALAAVAVLAVVFSLQGRPYDKLCFPENDCPTGSAPFARVIENRHGVVAVAHDNRTVIGGGVYDGMFNVNPLHDVNMIKRCYSLFGFLSRPPKHVLMIGLSSGSWAQVLASHPDVESLTIVEINPGYLKLIPEHSEVASILHNPKVEIIIDDGHRWLLRNPEAKFDLIVMNTTFFWRANATNLLSREFLELARRHMEPGAAHFYNTTWSGDVQFTAASVFPYAVRIANFIAVSDAPLRFHADHWKELMKAYRIDGALLLDPSHPDDDQVFLDKVVNDAQLAESAPISPANRAAYFELEASLRSRWASRTVITDDNMAVEWRGTQP